MTKKEGLIILERGFALKTNKKRQQTGAAASADLEEGEFPEAIEKILKEEKYLPEKIFNADKSPLLWGEREP